MSVRASYIVAGAILCSSAWLWFSPGQAKRVEHTSSSVDGPAATPRAASPRSRTASTETITGPVPLKLPLPQIEQERQGPKVSTDSMDKRAQEMFDGDAYDPEWSRTAEEQARKNLNAYLPATSHIRSLECRKMLCRSELSHQDRETALNYVHQLMINAAYGWNGQLISQVDEERPGGAARARLYLVRVGQTVQLEPSGNEQGSITGSANDIEEDNVLTEE